MTKEQEKLLENFVRKEVRKSLKEADPRYPNSETFTVYKRQVNPNGLVEIESYNVKEVAEKVCKVMNQAAPNMKGQRNKSGQDYIVKSE